MHRAPYALKDFVLIVGQRVRLRPLITPPNRLRQGLKTPISRVAELKTRRNRMQRWLGAGLSVPQKGRRGFSTSDDRTKTQGREGRFA